MQIKKLISVLGSFLNVSCLECTCKQNNDLRDDLWKCKMGVHVLIGSDRQIRGLMPYLQKDILRIMVFDDVDEILFKNFSSYFNDFVKKDDNHIQVF